MQPFEKWKREFDKKYRTVTWLDFENNVDKGTNIINKLKCTVCSEFCSHILSKETLVISGY